MQGLRRQRGASFFFTLLFLVMLATLALEVLFILPAYFIDAKVKRALVTLPERMEEAAQAERGGTASTFKAEAKRLMRAYLVINGVKEEDVSINDLVFKRVNDGVEISIDYEVRRHVFYNIDAVMEFSHAVVVPEKND